MGMIEKVEAQLIRHLLIGLAQIRHGSTFKNMEPVWGCQNVEDGVISQRFSEDTVVHQLCYNDPTNQNTTHCVEVRTTLKTDSKGIWKDIMPNYKPGILA